jgi:CDP-glucose 4,6-dehydratase
VLTSVRAGNVVGGGDWSKDRLIPDIIRAVAEGATVSIRSPDSVRPWQHVIDPLRGYLLVAQQGFRDRSLPGAFNFGPRHEDTLTVAEIVARMAKRWGPEVKWRIDRPADAPHEARMLRLDSSLARSTLGWAASIPIDTTVDLIVDWHRAHFDGKGAGALLELTRRQITQWGMA